MSNRYFKIAIHVKPWVKKYIVANYGDTILISMKNPGSMVLYSFLQKQNIPFRDNQEVMDRRFDQLTQSFYLLIQRRDQYKHGLYIHKNNHLLINNYFELEVYRRIFHQCDTYAKVKMSRESAVEDFCGQNDIELHKDISLEAVLKADQRHRAKKNLKKDRAILSTEKNCQKITPATPTFNFQLSIFNSPAMPLPVHL